ncbi:hypothetical protein [Dentiradicibacter hellwigii]|uniref:Uncharacterized protein n=1 Tax=Dentiradicibacter hellwigii TaxID=3149053 RepID=A0ABV4UGT1_9RHOO
MARHEQKNAIIANRCGGFDIGIKAAVTGMNTPVLPRQAKGFAVFDTVSTDKRPADIFRIIAAFRGKRRG